MGIRSLDQEGGINIGKLQCGNRKGARCGDYGN